MFVFFFVDAACVRCDVFAFDEPATGLGARRWFGASSSLLSLVVLLLDAGVGVGRFGVGAGRFGADRIGVGAGRLGVGADRIGVDAGRFDGAACFPDVSFVFFFVGAACVRRDVFAFDGPAAGLGTRRSFGDSSLLLSLVLPVGGRDRKSMLSLLTVVLLLSDAPGDGGDGGGAGRFDAGPIDLFTANFVGIFDLLACLRMLLPTVRFQT